ncbi:MAG: hypothetical protein KAH38_08185 [Candidatus Hydrogenedentes bacterium]|nr:hypothetical protein [Candidatus Hydrogenedentota bacterium]
MKIVLGATPIKGFNIKTTTGVLFGGQELLPPFDQHLLDDMEEHPFRWEIRYGQARKSPTAVAAKEATPEKQATSEPKPKVGMKRMKSKKKVTK